MTKITLIAEYQSHRRDGLPIYKLFEDSHEFAFTTNYRDAMQWFLDMQRRTEDRNKYDEANKEKPDETI